jgi:hypothetical protein
VGSGPSSAAVGIAAVGIAAVGIAAVGTAAVGTGAGTLTVTAARATRLLSFQLFYVLRSGVTKKYK